MSVFAALQVGAPRAVGDGMTAEDGAKPVAERYHHGALREALIDSAYDQVSREGVEKLSIAGLCKTLGVSTAAPYRHFTDRNALISEVSARGFRALEHALREARDGHPPGSIDGLIALGKAYVRFVASDPEMFHLMWGATRENFDSDIAFCAGQTAFAVLVECVRAIQIARDVDHLDTMQLAVSMWSGVHGLAALQVGRRLRVAEGLDVDGTVEFATRAFIAGLTGGRA